MMGRIGASWLAALKFYIQVKSNSSCNNFSSSFPRALVEALLGKPSACWLFSITLIINSLCYVCTSRGLQVDGDTGGLLASPELDLWSVVLEHF